MVKENTHINAKILHKGKRTNTPVKPSMALITLATVNNFSQLLSTYRWCRSCRVLRCAALEKMMVYGRHTTPHVTFLSGLALMKPLIRLPMPRLFRQNNSMKMYESNVHQSFFCHSHCHCA